MKTRTSRLCTFTVISLLSFFGFADQAEAQGYVFNRLNGSPKSWAKAAKTHKAKSASAASSGYQVLYNFCSAANCTDGLKAGLIQDAGGNLYSTTLWGGTHFYYGTVFKVDTTGHETVLYNFCTVQYPYCDDGAGAVAGLIQDASGNLYGTASMGNGTPGGGTVFKVNTAGQETVLYSFCEINPYCSDGATPQAGLIQDAGGNFYGTTGGGGANQAGTVFELNPAGQETVLYSFCSDPNCTDGSYPRGSLIQDAAGNLYGATSGGGNGWGGISPGYGTVFKLDTTGHETVLYRFCSALNCSDGSYPNGNLIQDAAGNLYGTTAVGGNGVDQLGLGGYGTVFEVDTTGQETVLYSFCPAASPCPDGAYPQAGLIADAAGNLYGTTLWGGANTTILDNEAVGGTVFKLAPPAQSGGSWTEAVLYSFCSATNCADGESPDGVLMLDSGVTLYGTTYGGGANTDPSLYAQGAGTVFKLANETGGGSNFDITSSVQSLSLKAGQSSNVTITLTQTSGFFNGQISFSCSQQTLVSCRFNPVTISVNGVPVNTMLTVTASSAAASLGAPTLHGRAPITLAFDATFASFAVGTVLIAFPRRRRLAAAFFSLLIAVAIVSWTGCGNDGGPQPQTAMVTVSATAGGNSSRSLSLTITVTP